MHPCLSRACRALPVLLGAITLAGVGALLVWDAFPQLFPGDAHPTLAAFPLACIAVAYLLYSVPRRQSILDLVKPIVISAAFLFWAANQLWPKSPRTALFNDIAIALFALDIFLVIAGWPEI
jgi:hypothetical protein